MAEASEAEISRERLAGTVPAAEEDQPGSRERLANLLSLAAEAEQEVDAIIARLDAGIAAAMDASTAISARRRDMPVDDAAAERETDEIIARLEYGIPRARTELDDLLASLRAEREVA